MVKKKNVENVEKSLIYDQIADITHEFGDVEVRNFEDEVMRFEYHIPTGLAKIDNKLENGKGLPCGGVIEVFGPESSGKSHLALKICANAQRKYPDKIVMYYDLEAALLPDRCRALGVDTSKNKFMVVDNALDAEALINQMVKVIEGVPGKISVIVLDSIASLIPKDLYEKEVDNRTTLLAALLSKKLKILNTIANKNNVGVIFINQLRENINMYGGGGMTYTPGGRSLRHVALLRIEVKPVPKSKGGLVEKNGEVIGHKSIVKIIKNKLGSPIGEDVFSVYYSDDVTVQDRLFWLGRELDHYVEKTKIIGMHKGKFSFDDHIVEGEEEFKKAMFRDGFVDELFDAILHSGSADGLSKEEIEVAKKIFAEESQVKIAE